MAGIPLWPGRPAGVPASPFRGRPAARAALLLVAFLAAACAPSRTGYLRAAPAPPSPPRELPYQVVYLIHGDADYVWHDKAGRRGLADQDALAQAREVASRLPLAEVLVFHQTPRRHRWSHPRKDGTFLHYRGGRLLRASDYSRSGRDGRLAAEAELFRLHAADSRPEARILFWFGHEIPLSPMPGYSRSHPGQTFALADLLRAMERFAASGGGSPSGKPYSLVALSACRGGVPAATAALFPLAERVIASPARLHLSHLDSRALVPWLSRPGAGSRDAAREGAEAVARASFAALADRTVTAVTLAAYESGAASAYLAGHAGPWDNPQGTVHARYGDCGERPGFGAGGAEAGVLVLHRPPRFGPGRGKRSHSGWECPEEPAAPRAGTAGRTGKAGKAGTAGQAGAGGDAAGAP